MMEMTSPKINNGPQVSSGYVSPHWFPEFIAAMNDFTIRQPCSLGYQCNTTKSTFHKINQNPRGSSGYVPPPYHFPEFLAAVMHDFTTRWLCSLDDFNTKLTSRGYVRPRGAQLPPLPQLPPLHDVTAKHHNTQSVFCVRILLHISPQNFHANKNRTALRTKNEAKAVAPIFAQNYHCEVQSSSARRETISLRQ